MTDIRPIRESEVEDYVSLLTDVFDLEFDKALDAFQAEPMFDLGRKWALFEGRHMTSVLATTPLRFGWGSAIGIAGVATPKAARGEGHASKLIARVLKESEKRDEAPALLFAQQTTLYERLGFEPIDRVISAPIVVDAQAEEPMLAPADARTLYNAWANEDPNRLRRDGRRWSYWDWMQRTIQACGPGYLCYEGEVLREAVVPPGLKSLPLPNQTSWFGLTVVADLLELPIVVPRVELVLMGRGVPGVPQLFLTDQF